MNTTPFILLALGLLAVVLSILIGLLCEIWRDKPMLNDIYCRIQDLFLKLKRKFKNQ